MKKTLLLLFTVTLLALFSSGCTKYMNESYSEPPQQNQTLPAQDEPNVPSEEQQEDTPQASQPTEKKQNPVVTIEMENGNKIVIELYPDVAPNTVNNFISLINKKFYDGLIFHRVIPGFMIQGGDPQGTGMGGPGYTIKGEFPNNGFQNNLLHERGVISMARESRNPDSAGSQFFIMVADAPHLDGDYAAFGKVIEGMEEVDNIVNTQTDANDKPLKEQKIKKVTVETFGVTYPEPEKM